MIRSYCDCSWHARLQTCGRVKTQRGTPFVTFARQMLIVFPAAKLVGWLSVL